MASDLSELRRKSQENLVSFLTVELDLARTYCEIAQGVDSEEKAKLMGDVLKIVEAVRHFQEHIKDQTIREDLLKRTAEVEKLLAPHSK